jgi:hypothetical protein
MAPRNANRKFMLLEAITRTSWIVIMMMVVMMMMIIIKSKVVTVLNQLSPTP